MQVFEEFRGRARSMPRIEDFARQLPCSGLLSEIPVSRDGEANVLIRSVSHFNVEYRHRTTHGTLCQ